MCPLTLPGAWVPGDPSQSLEPGRLHNEHVCKKAPQPASRPPVDAIQYEKLALAAFRVCDQRREQIDKLVTLAASICMSPAVTIEERNAQKRLLQVLVDTGENYKQMNGCDEELFQVVALNAKGIAQRRLTAAHAANLLTDAARGAPNGVSLAAPQKSKQAKAAAQTVPTSH